MNFITQLNAQVNRIGQHEAITGWNVSTTPYASSTEGKKMIQDIMDAVGIKANFDVRVANIPNAAAVTFAGKKFILYNPIFIDTLIQKTGTKWSAISVLAHEIGHHVNGTPTETGRSQKQSELDADEFSGYALRKMGASVEQAEIALKMATGTGATRTHPAQYDRLLAIENGWKQADNALAARNMSNSSVGERGFKLSSDNRSYQNTVASGWPSSTGLDNDNAILNDQTIVGKVYFNADPNSTFYITRRLNLVKVKPDGLAILGKITSLNSQEFPFLIYDENNTELLVDSRGNIVTKGGRQVGLLKSYR